MIGFWRPTAPTPCSACRKVVSPHAWVVETNGARVNVYHAACVREELRCAACRWIAQDADLLREHARTVHRPPDTEIGAPRNSIGRTDKSRRVPLAEIELRARQNEFLERLQTLEPGRPIEVQHSERDKWHPWMSCADRGCGSRLLWTRGLARSEAAFDFDEKTYSENARYARVLHGTLREAGVPHQVFSTGSKGIHVCVYIALPDGATDDRARDVREAVWKHFLEAAALDGVARVDKATVGWTSHHMLHAWGHVRKAPYTYMERPMHEQPRTTTMPPKPSAWDPMGLEEVREILERTKDDHGTKRLDAGAVLQAHAIDLEDFEHYPFVRELTAPKSDHDEALVMSVLLAKTAGLSEDETVAFMAAYWAPRGPCDSPGHRPGSQLTSRVRSVYRSKWLLKPARAYKLLKSWGKEPDSVVWKALFRRLPLALAEGEARRAAGCGGIKWVTCASCGRDVPIEIHCRATAVCADCQQHRYVEAALRFRGEIQGRLSMGMPMYVLEVPLAPATSYDDAKATEAAIRKRIVCDADVEFLRVVMPDKITYTAFAPFSVDGAPPSIVRTFGAWLRSVVPLKSWRVVFRAVPDVDQAAGTWEMSAHGKRLFQGFGWHRRGEAEPDQRTFKAAPRGPVLCPYCSGRMYAASLFDYTASLPRDRALFRQAGIGPP